MAMDLPPQAPVPVMVSSAQVAEAPECRLLTPEQAAVAFARLKSRLRSTEFTEFRPSEVCGLVQLRMARGGVAYTDATGRYFLLALALDTHRGGPADESNPSLDTVIDRLVEDRTINPAQAAPDALRSTAPAGNSD